MCIFKKDKEKIIFKIENDNYCFSLKTKKFYINDKEVSKSKFKKELIGQKYSYFEAENDDTLSKVYMAIFDTFMVRNRTSIVTAIDLFIDNNYLEKYILYIYERVLNIKNSSFTFDRNLKSEISNLCFTNIESNRILSENINVIKWIDNHGKYTKKYMCKVSIYDSLCILKREIKDKTKFINYFSNVEYIMSYFDYLFGLRDLVILLSQYKINTKDFCSYLDYLIKDELIKISGFLKLYLDYLEDVNKIEEKLGIKYKKFPKNFLTVKNILRQELLKIEELEKENKLKERIKYLDTYKQKVYIDMYVFKKPETYKEMIDEGNNLHHCVSGYYNRVCEGNSLIYFLREKTSENISLCTIEVDPKEKILKQVRLSLNALVEKNTTLYNVIKLFCDKMRIKFNDSLFKDN